MNSTIRWSQVSNLILQPVQFGLGFVCISQINNNNYKISIVFNENYANIGQKMENNSNFRGLKHGK